MKQLLFILSIFFLSFQSNAQSKSIVFTSGTEGYKTFRIPSIIQYKKELLAFAEGRVNGGADFGDIDIVMKRSKDGGKSWSAIQVVASYDSLQAGNCAPVVDLADPQYPNGRIFLFFNTGNKSEAEIRKGKGMREVWYQTSIDGGEHWSAPTNITAQVHRPSQAPYLFKEDWRSYANTPGHAIQFETGKYNGRIYVAANHSFGDPVKHFEEYRAHAFYSDDHGKTFHLSDVVDIAGSNEAMAVELSNDQVMMNIRNQQGDKRERIIAISKDGGEHWNNTYFDPQLPDPVCQGSILWIGNKKGKHVLAFCNAADTKKRDNLLLRISEDEGKTWKDVMTIEKSEKEEKGDYAAYSDLVKISKNSIGVLYERYNYSEIVFSVCKWK